MSMKLTIGIDVYKRIRKTVPQNIKSFNMTTKEEIMLINHRLEEMEKKIEGMDEKLDMLIKRLMDPDTGVAARVNQNTAARKGLTRALWILYGIVAAAIAKALWL